MNTKIPNFHQIQYILLNIFYLVIISIGIISLVSPASHIYGANEDVSVYSIPKWDNISLYRPGDYVEYEGVYYVSRFPNIDHPPNLNLAHLWNILPIPEVATTIASLPNNIPLRLFDIVLNIVDATLSNSRDLVAITEFTSFGSATTLVNLVYRIEDVNKKVVFTSSDGVVVETERVVTREFKELDLAPGKYTLFLTTIYGEGIQDEFRQTFQIRSKINYMVMGMAALVTVGVVGYIIYTNNNSQVLNLRA